MTDFNLDTVSSRLNELAFLNQGLKITLRDERAKQVIETEGGERAESDEPFFETYCYQGGISDFARYLNDGKTPLDLCRVRDVRRLLVPKEEVGSDEEPDQEDPDSD